MSIPTQFYKRKFGCEFEFSTDFIDFAEIVTPIVKRVCGKNRLKVLNECYRSINNLVKWHVKADASTQVEFCTPVSSLIKLEDIEQIVRALQAKRIKISENDSFHVHVGSSDLNKKSLLALWLRYERIIYALFPKHRRNNNTFCTRAIQDEPLSNELVAHYFKNAMTSTEDHHSGISFTYHKQNGSSRNTVEFRLAEGTLNMRLIRNWIAFLLYLVEKSKNKQALEDRLCEEVLPVRLSALETMIQELDIEDEKLIKWLRFRLKKFA
jgi:hypothetical protein